MPDYVIVGACWIWARSAHVTGYGRINRDGQTYAHRWSYEQHKGPIPEGLMVHHTCFNRLCVNPDHLEAVTCSENNQASIHRREGRNRKLDPNIVRTIRASDASHRSLAAHYGVTPTCIADVRRGRTWKDA